MRTVVEGRASRKPWPRGNGRCYREVVLRSLLPLILGLAVVGACQRVRHSAQDAAVTHCLAKQVVFLHKLQEGDSVDYETLACKNLYQEGSCGDAWQDVLRQAGNPSDGKGIRLASSVPDLASVVGPCAKAYCDRLSAPLPALCSGPVPTDNAALVDAVQALDVAILKHDLGDPRVATALGWKANVFRQVVVTLSEPSPKATASSPLMLAVEMLPGVIFVDGERVTDEILLSHARRAQAENPDTRAVLRADSRVPHGEVMRVLDLLKRAGIAKIAFAVAAPAPAASASGAAP